jgi:DinB family protein
MRLRVWSVAVSGIAGWKGNFNAMRALATAVAIGAVGLLVFAGFAQGSTNEKPLKPALTSSKAVLQSWKQIGSKLIAMAEDFPEDKYDFRPSAVQRTFAEQLLHVAGSNDLFTDVAKGRKPETTQASQNRLPI